ncbi:hypothetical protein BLNAU_12423 [Blattamonas nauphoetae]|uniref:Uncharacterized protein n=1 Tax=Blattamonas nauphoetae TaxID=2049346 RepID=A0ABQ9XM81_9EUKA|nr:hypothetical protein BLNAU_12423 [Blattamonas nauphoetae]
MFAQLQLTLSIGDRGAVGQILQKIQCTFREDLVSATSIFISLVLQLNHNDLIDKPPPKHVLDNALLSLFQTILTSLFEQSRVVLSLPLMKISKLCVFFNIVFTPHESTSIHELRPFSTIHSAVLQVCVILETLHLKGTITLTPDAHISLYTLVQPFVSSALPELQKHEDDTLTLLFGECMRILYSVFDEEIDINTFDPFSLPCFFSAETFRIHRHELREQISRNEKFEEKEQRKMLNWKQMTESPLFQQPPFDTTSLTSEERERLESQDGSSLETDSIESDTLRTSLPSYPSPSLEPPFEPSLPLSSGTAPQPEISGDSAPDWSGPGIEHTQNDEKLIQTLVNITFTLVSNPSPEFIPLNAALFSHLAHLLNSHNPTIRRHLLNLVIHLTDSPIHKPFLVTDTLPTILTFPSELSVESTSFMGLILSTTSIEDLYALNSSRSSAIDSTSTATFPLTDPSNKDLSSILALFEAFSHSRPSQDLDISTFSNTNEAEDVEMAHLNQLKSEVKQFVPTISSLHNNPESFKLSIGLLHPSQQFLEILTLFSVCLALELHFPPVLVEYYLVEGWKFEEHPIIAAIDTYGTSISSLFRSGFPVDVLIERVARKVILSQSYSQLTELVDLIDCLFQKHRAIHIHPFLLRGLHLIEPADRTGLNKHVPSIFQSSLESMPYSGHSLFVTFPPPKMIHLILVSLLKSIENTTSMDDKDFKTLIGNIGLLMIQHFTFDEWRDIRLFLRIIPSEWDFDRNKARTPPIQAQLRLLLTFALPPTFHLPFRPLSPPRLWSEPDLSAFAPIYVHEQLNDRRVDILIVLAIARSCVRDVTTAALMFVRRIVGHRNDTWNRRLISLSVFELVVRAVEASSHLEDLENGAVILSELLRTAQKGIVGDEISDDDVSLGSVWENDWISEPDEV